MKKVLLLLLALTLSFTLAACNTDDNNGGEDEDRTAPVIEGTDDVTIYLNEDFDPMDGVTATDHEGNDITDDVEVVGSVDTSSAGTEYIRYKIEDSEGLSSESARYVTVEVDPDNIGDEMVKNGDFSMGWALWDTTTGLEGGNASFTVVDGELEIDIESVTSAMWEPRLENIGIEFEQDQAYEVSFDARAADPRAVHVQVGEILDDSPYFDNFKEGITTIFDLSDTMETYTFEFMMGKETNDNGALIFEMGTIEHETTGTDNLFTKVYLDNVEINPIDDYEDTAAPVILGADDKAITVGDDFDPLEGVTAEDNVDGEITLDESNVSGNVDTDTPGDYALTYTVSDAAGNEETHERTITVKEESVDTGLKSADYGWRLFTEDGKATTEGEVVDGEYVLSVTDTTGSEETLAGWHVQMIQDAYALETGEDNEGSMNFEAGATYKMTFDAKASVAGNITVDFGYTNLSDYSFTAYDSEADIAITDTMETITYEFTLDDTDMDYSTPAQLKIVLGDLFAGSETEQTFTIDNVKLEKQDDSDTFVETDLIENGSFTAEEPTYKAADYGWRTFTNDWEGSASGSSVVDGQYQVMLDSNNVYEDWHVQLIQDAYAMGLGEDNEGSINFETGETYKISFDAMANTGGDIVMEIGHNNSDGSFNAYATESAITLTDSMQTFTYEFTLDDDTIDYSTPAQLKFIVGALFNGESLSQAVTFDNVIIEKQDGTDYVETDLVENGIFEAMTADYGWRTFTNDWEGSAANVEVIDGEYNVSLDANSTYEAWHVQVIQDAFALGTGPDNAGSIDFETGESYQVSFDAMANIGGDIDLEIGYTNDDGDFISYATESAVTVTDSMQTFVYEFTLNDDAIDYSNPAQIKLIVGSLFVGESLSQAFVLDNVKIEKLDGEDYVETDLIENGTFTPETDITKTADYGWRAFTNNWEGSEANPVVVDEQYELSLNSNNTYEAWHVQIIQDGFSLGTGPDNSGALEFEADETYRVSFDAMANTGGDIDLGIGYTNPDDSFTAYGEQNGITITDSMQTFTYEFTFDDDSIDYTTPAQFKLIVGSLFIGEPVSQTFTLDNIIIEKHDGTEYVDAGIIVNGDFTN
ncbi:MAG: carbohydrate binding domain-containing protein [Bacillota bacterium]